MAWSPVPQHPYLFVTGTIAGTLDSDFNASAHLEVFSVDLTAEPEKNLKVLGKTSASDRFRKLCWSSSGVQGGHLPYGIIAGGLGNGSINVWDPEKIINGEESLIAVCDKHVGPVQGLDFNPSQQNLLASSGQDSEIFIWDLQNTQNPTVYNLGSKNQGQLSESGVTCVAWNKKVPHISFQFIFDIYFS